MAEAGAGPSGGPLKPALALTINALVWGLSWWPLRELQALGLHPLWSTAGVYLLSLGVLLAVRPQSLAECRGHAALGWLAVVAGLTNVGFNWAVSIGDVVRVVLLFYTMPAWVVLLAWPLLGERPTVASVLRLLLALAGVVVVLDPGLQRLPLPREPADWLALGAGLCFALTNILLRKLDQVPPNARVVAMFVGGMLMAAATASVGLAQGLLPAPVLPLAGWPVALLLGVAFLGGNLALQYGASRLPAQATSLIMLSEVIFASVSSVALGAAVFSPGIATGGALILVAAAWSAWPTRPPGPPARND
jgi:drug/metabolite transporter (DMT)-like permease